MAIAGGLFTGFITSRSWFQPPPEEALFDDKHHWEISEIEHDKSGKIDQVPKTVEQDDESDNNRVDIN